MDNSQVKEVEAVIKEISVSVANKQEEEILSGVLRLVGIFIKAQASMAESLQKLAYPPFHLPREANKTVIMNLFKKVVHAAAESNDVHELHKNLEELADKYLKVLHD